MTDMTMPKTEGLAVSSQAYRKRIKKRYAAERRFRAYGIAAIAVAVAFLIGLLGTITAKGAPAFLQTNITLNIFFDPEKIDTENLNGVNFQAMARNALYDMFPEVTERREKRQLGQLISVAADQQLREMVRADPSLIGQRKDVQLLAGDDLDLVVKGTYDLSQPEAERPVSDVQVAWIDKLQAQGHLARGIAWPFLTTGDSREPEMAGIWGAVMGSLLTLSVTLAVSFPIGVLAAVYLQEFATKNRWNDLIEVNINNLAAVPSIVFGLLGLAVFLNFFGMPRSAPLVGGLVLALMTLPTIIIATRAALAAVPPSIREAALGVGASELQVVTHHVVPLAMPGILTGTIIGLAQALGETAPLLMIGMVAFIVDVPANFTDPATVLPVQIYLWADSPERAFEARTSAAIMVLIGFLILMNAIAVVLRRRFERRW
ncbi:MAG: phosphate ABC transporter permease PstA [Rhizobiales bacterium]|nr:phosphate ABC transporter permease PstA [Hyphomicrobiales bacterium]